MSEELAEFERLIGEKAKGYVSAQVVRVKVKSVDWNEKTMTATGALDELDYYKVSLGLGAFIRKPKINTQAIILLIDNKPNGILLDAEEWEEQLTSIGSTAFKIKQEGYEIKRGNENLKDVLNDFIDEVNKIIVVQGTTINVPAVIAIKQRLNSILI